MRNNILGKNNCTQNSKFLLRPKMSILPSVRNATLFVLLIYEISGLSNHFLKTSKHMDPSFSFSHDAKIEENVRMRFERAKELSQMITRKNFISAFFVTGSFPSFAFAANLPLDYGADLTRTGSIDTLIPIVSMQRCVWSAKSKVVNSEKRDTCEMLSSEECKTLIRQLSQSIPREEKSFKRLFDEYSSPVSYKQKFLDQNAFLVYYSKGFDGPGRAGIENSGGDVTNSLQTKQYGARNDAWVAMNDLFTELEYSEKSGGNISCKDYTDLVDAAVISFQAYLDLAPAADVQGAYQKSVSLRYSYTMET